MRFQTLWAGVAMAGAAAAQFVFPNSSASLQVNRPIQIQWNKSGLQAPISINLVPAGAAIRQDIVLKQVAVNIGNAGILQWTADETITAFPKFAMVIIDARSQVVVSQPFLIQSLTRQPTQQIDLGNGSAGNRNGNKQNGDKEKAKNTGDKEKAKNNGDKEKAKNNGDNKNNKDNANANKDGKKGNGNGNGQKEQAKDKDQNKDGANNGLLPLPGLPAGDAPPVSLKPLPTAATTPASTQVVVAPTASPAKPGEGPAVPTAGEEASEAPKAAPAAPAPAPAPPAAPAVPEAAPEAPVAAPAAPEAAPEAPKAAPEAPEAAPAAPETSAAAPETPTEPSAAAPAPVGFVAVQPSASATPALTPAAEVEAAAAVPGSFQNAAAVIAGGSFREQTSGTSPAPTLLSLPSQEGQETITTAITPRPASVVSSEARAAASETVNRSAGAGAKPTIKAEKNAAQRRDPSLALGLLGVVAGLALL